MPVPDKLVAKGRRLLLFSLQDSKARALAADLRRNNWDVVLADDPVQLGYLIAKDKPSALLMMDLHYACRLYTSDAADDLQCVDLGGCRLLKYIFAFVHIYTVY